MAQLKNKRLFLFLGVIISIGTAAFLLRSFHKSAFSEGRKNGILIGHQEGFVDGRLKGLQLGEEQTQAIVEMALMGAPLLLADVELENNIPYQAAIHTLNKEKSYRSPAVKTVIQQFSSDVNFAILERIIDKSGIEQKVRDTIISNFEKNRDLIGSEAYAQYVAHFKQLRARATTFDKIKALTNATSGVSCEFLSVLSPKHRLTIAAQLLTLGQERRVKEFNKTELKISEAATSYISDQFCHLLVYNSMNFVAGAMMDYASIIDFTEQELVASHKMEKVMQLVTARSEVTFLERVSYVRDWAPDPNFSISVNSSVIAGIDLSKYYCVEFFPRTITESGRTEIVISLPQPAVLSIHPSIRPQSENVLFATGLKDNEMNHMFNMAKNVSHNKAIEEGILEDAKKGAIDALNTLYTPLFLNTERNYKLVVKFVDERLIPRDKVILKG